MIEATIFLDEDDLYEGKPMYEHIMRHLMHNNISGASMFGAKAGFGSKHHLHRPGKLGASDERSIMVIFIDEDEKVQAVLPHLKEIVKEGLIVIKKAERI